MKLVFGFFTHADGAIAHTLAAFLGMSEKKQRMRYQHGIKHEFFTVVSIQINSGPALGGRRDGGGCGFRLNWYIFLL